MLIFKNWLTTQFYAYIAELKALLMQNADNNEGLKLKALAIRTMMGVICYVV